jgi:hypothetical protein
MSLLDKIRGEFIHAIERAVLSYADILAGCCPVRRRGEESEQARTV